MAQPGKTVRLFVSDIDGCLSEPYRPYDLRKMASLVELVRQEETPLFSLCSGRAYPYVEAMTQVLGLTTPVLFESGGGMFDPVEASIRWNPHFSKEVEDTFASIREWLIRTIVPGSSLMYDYGKRTQTGVIGPRPEDVARNVPIIEDHIETNYPGFRVFHTDVSIDVVYAEITKRQALEWMANTLGMDVSEFAYIGDTNGDLEALRLVGRSFAPANGTPEVRAAVQTVCSCPLLPAVIEAFRTCVDENAAAARLVGRGT
jgi:phosphoglycolate phosphatase